MKNYISLIKGTIAVQQFILLIFTVLFLSFTLLSCDVLVPWVIEFDKERFDLEWAAWEEQGLVDYSVRQEHSNYRPGMLIATIVVQNGTIIEKEALDEWSLAQLEKNSDYKPRILDLVKTISEIYIYINSRYESKEKKGLNIEITYNKEYHYPEYIKISYENFDEAIGLRAETILMSEFIPLVSEAEE